jgi:hypothetical protein
VRIEWRDVRAAMKSVRRSAPPNARFKDLAKNNPNADQTARVFATIDGYPVRTRMYEADGKFRNSETVLMKPVEESIPAWTFEVPAGYKKQAMPTMPPP